MFRGFLAVYVDEQRKLVCVNGVCAIEIQREQCLLAIIVV